MRSCLILLKKIKTVSGAISEPRAGWSPGDAQLCPVSQFLRFAMYLFPLQFLLPQGRYDFPFTVSCSRSPAQHQGTGVVLPTAAGADSFPLSTSNQTLKMHHVLLEGKKEKKRRTFVFILF